MEYLNGISTERKITVKRKKTTKKKDSDSPQKDVQEDEKNG